MYAWSLILRSCDLHACKGQNIHDKGVQLHTIVNQGHKKYHRGELTFHWQIYTCGRVPIPKPCKVRIPKPIQRVSSPTLRNHCGAHLLVIPCFLIDKVLPSVAWLSHTLVIVGGSQLRPPVIHGLLWDKRQRMERILICRDELILTGNGHTFYWVGVGVLCSGPWHFLSLLNNVFV